jgi:hypothetical protein
VSFLLSPKIASTLDHTLDHTLYDHHTQDGRTITTNLKRCGGDPCDDAQSQALAVAKHLPNLVQHHPTRQVALLLFRHAREPGAKGAVFVVVAGQGTLCLGSSMCFWLANMHEKGTHVRKKERDRYNKQGGG